MKKIPLLFLALGLSFISLSASAQEHFTGISHQFLFEKGLMILANDNKLEGNNLFFKAKEDILSYVTEPDQTETSFFTFKGHFYDPTTGTNWQGETHHTALTNFISYSKQGVTAGNSYWTKDLGYALHYLEDACQPHHASNLIAFFSKHQEYESFLESIQDQVRLENNLYNYSSSVTKDFEADLTAILRNCGLKNRDVAAQIEDSDDQTLWFNLSINVLKESQSAVALFLYRFMLEKNKR